MVDLATMQPQNSLERNAKINPSSDWMPDKDYTGNTSDGKSYVTGKAKDTPVDVAEIEREMEGLSFQDRIMAENTVIGISTGAISIWEKFQKILSTKGSTYKTYRDLPEDDEMLTRLFKEVDEELAKIVRQNDSVDDTDLAAYKLARRQNKEYIDNYLFKIDFLRAERYQVNKAARRIIRYLGEKRELFGDDKLTRVIYWEDLGDDVIAYFRRGAIQILPEPDLHGRRVLFVQGVANGSSDEEILVAKKAYFYFWSTLTETETKKGRLLGIVAIMWKLHKIKTKDPKLTEAVHRAWQCCPVKVSAYHICQRWPPSDFKAMKIFAMRFITWFRNSGELRLLRSHHGTEEKCTKVLVKEFGCPDNSLSELTQMTEDCSNRIVFVEQWIAERQNIDSQMELLLESIKSVGSSLMSPKEYTAMTTESMLEQGSINLSLNFQSVNQRVLIELTSLTADSKVSFNESDLSMAASEMMFSRISRFSSGSIGVDSLGSLPWMNGDEPMGDSIEDIWGEALEESQKLVGDGNDQYEDMFSQPLGESEKKANGSNEVTTVYNKKGHDAGGFIYENAIADRDIKLGRGKPLQRHPGNIWFRDQIRRMFPDYDRSEKSQQTQLSREMVQFVRNENRRFLAAAPKLKGYWREISDDEAREKVAVNFRTERKRRSKHQFTFGK
mmetsp:Transcript_23180/g.54812  ORF Transcript_23180/g.54812 Transcript_23180/m.54812 type:complete len:669 (+) Transcript_23180:217-2223(+)|eukprot:CAMPEP_0197190428 /NCGR_PEP_ID=MMETSP1423-20130617/21633_1 /TAXON_ID=476441 /ORGANISM="Pseudo-nitzschia heimii, Strain UNC1101" /LENGTH=668 /DNA_ID=CAMNT_0042642809 /DNA_START=143 /DNA_END=2149 /DNA_ORIENTATION=+